ncbi:hypothetical protein T03_8219 [Trichinella britovi]|uniref:Uncharacterized protein n=1 Tax=Trichinella britovi TaxID=45882 RepID=A0A0V1D6T2_TRIBR|nr:hypothetical protein T03_8219 [Trichinella britovi]
MGAIMSCHILFFQAEHKNVSKLCLDARYNRRNETNRKIKMLLAAFFLCRKLMLVFACFKLTRQNT